MNQRQNKEFIILLLGGIFLAGIALTLDLQAQEKETHKSDPLTIFEEVVSLIQTNYFKQTNISELVCWAIKGMEEKAVKDKTSPHHRERICPGVVSFSESFSQFSMVFSTLSQDTGISPRHLLEAGIQEMLKNLDSHSRFLPPSDGYVETRSLPQFGGIGVKITQQKEQLIVVVSLTNTPAFRAGIRAGDRITNIDGLSTHTMGLWEAVMHLRGAEGTEVTMTLVKHGEENPENVTITRDRISLESVKYNVLEQDIGYIQLDDFQEDSPQKVQEALEHFQHAQVRPLIVDVRNNLGGFLNASLGIAEQFLHEGDLITSTISRVEEQKRRFIAQQTSTHIEYPVIILVNQSSTGVAELFAGALQAHGKGVVIGTPTSGKGVFRSVFLLSDNSGLLLTTALYLTPQGHVIEGHGIIPDVLVTSDKEQRHCERHIASELQNKPIIFFDERRADRTLQIAIDIITRAASNRREDFIIAAQEMSERP